MAESKELQLIVERAVAQVFDRELPKLQQSWSRASWRNCPRPRLLQMRTQALEAQLKAT